MRPGILKRLLSWVYTLGAVLLSLVIIAVGEVLPPMPAVQRFQDAHPPITQGLTGIAVAMTTLGVLLLAFTQFLVRVPDPRMKPQAQWRKTEGIVRAPRWFFSGIMLSAGFSDEARLWRVKRAFREGEWWRVPRWRRMTLMLAGAILTFYGLFGLLLLLSPPGLKFFLFLVVLYATVRSVYAFAVDRPFRKDVEGNE
jgi:hypothetical protein